MQPKEVRNLNLPATCDMENVGQRRVVYRRNRPGSGACGRADLPSCLPNAAARGPAASATRESCRLGRELLSSAADRSKYTGVDLACEAHRFRLGTDVLCVPQKNGNKVWSAISHVSRQGRAPSSSEEAKAGSDDCDAFAASDRVLFIARNPYVRLLSFYNDKVVGRREEVALSLNVSQAALGNLTFPQFVGALQRHRQATHEPPCAVDHHLCSQLSGCLYAGARSLRVLKLERQRVWFPCLVAALRLNGSALVGPEWRSFAHRDCFYAPDGVCSSESSPGILSMRQLLEVVGSVHPTNASNTYMDHYTRAAAAFVTSAYRDDLHVLGYPAWSGEGEINHGS